MRGLVAHIAANLAPPETHHDPCKTCGHQWHGLPCRRHGSPLGTRHGPCGCQGPYGTPTTATEETP